VNFSAICPLRLQWRCVAANRYTSVRLNHPRVVPSVRAIKGMRAKRPRDAKQLGKLKASHRPGRKRKAMAGRKNA
jgi:hypothetical protein